MRRGMRLADTLFLTLAVACLQIYVGIRCSSHVPDSCMFRPVHGFDWMLAASVAASLSSSALCFMGLEMNDHRQSADKGLGLELGSGSASVASLPCGLTTTGGLLTRV